MNPHVFTIIANNYIATERRVNLSVSNFRGDFLGDEIPKFVVITPYNSRTSFGVPTDDDDTFEIDGAIAVTLEAGEGYSFNDAVKSDHVIVVDNDLPEGLSIIPTVTSISEGTDAQFQIISHTNQQQDKTVMVELSQIGDFMSRSVATRAVIIPRGSNVGELDVPTVNDEVDELSGYIVATLVSTHGDNSISSYNRAVVLVEDDDVPLVAIFSIAESGVEGDEIGFLLRADQRAAHNVFINVGFTQVGNYLEQFVSETTVMLQLGETGAEVILQTRDDEIDEHDGIVTATLLDGQGYQINPNFEANTSVQLIDNDDAPEISITADLDSVIEGTDGLFTLTADRVSSADIEVDFEIGNEPIDLIAGELPVTVILSAYSFSTSLNIPTIDDDVYGNEGEILVSLSSGDGYTIANSTNDATVRILDNETPPVISVSIDAVEINEGDTASFQLSASRLSAIDLNIDIELSVSANDLLTENFALDPTIKLNELTESILLEVPTENDLIEGDGGTITLSILPGLNYELVDESNQVSVVVLDDDGSPEISISSSTTKINEGESAVFQITSSNPVESDRMINISAQSNSRNLFADAVSSPILLPAEEDDSRCYN